MSHLSDPKKGKYSAPDGSKTWEYLAIVTCSIFSFSIGTTVGWVSPTIIKLLEPGSPVIFTPEDISTMVAAAAVGHLASPLVTNAFVDRIGRRNTLLLSALPLLISSAMITMASHVWVFHAARLLAGFSLGMCICVSPMYLGEVSSTTSRGLASSSIGVMINLGILFAYGICPYLSISRVAGILMMITLVFIVSFWFMPESPYYLAMGKHYDEAEATLEKLRGRSDVSEELDVIKEDTMPKSFKSADKVASTGTLRDLFRGRANHRALLIAMIFLIPQHFGGYFFILMYGELIFKDAGTLIPSHLVSIIVGVSQLVSSVMSGLLVDRLGRKPMILGAGIVTGFANATMGCYLFLKEYTSFDVSEYSLVFLIAVIVQVFSFNCGLLGMHMVIMSEIFATDVKGIGMCFVGMCSACFAIFTSKAYIALAVTLSLGHSLPFVGAAALVWASTIILQFITPETKGKTFLQIQQDLDRR